MRTIDVNITKARLVNVHIQFPEDALALPSATATIHLFGSNGKKVSEYSLHSDDYHRKYNKEISFDLPDNILPSLGRVRDEIENVIIAHAQSQFKQLPPAAVLVEEEDK